MEKETWRQIDECLADALELPPVEREDFLRSRLDTGAIEEALKLVARAEAADRLFAKGPLAGLSGLEAGARLGPWELVRPLGSGGMGVVWLARRVDGQARMQAAIKLLPPALSGPLREDHDLKQRFLMEKQILARLQHRNIARLLDAGAGVGDTPNFVMEYVEGLPLMEYLRRKGVDRLQLFLKICEAVQYAHANLVIHRDLKPQNILVDADGEPKLLDFGIGKILNDPAGDSSVTLRRAFSLDYASPEQIRGGVISTSTDVYSLGLILFEMMTGERARRWNDKALGEVLAESDRFEVSARSGLSADLLAVLRKATAVEEGRRYGSVAEFAADVERLVEGMPVEARPAGWLYRAGCIARRHWLAVSVSSLALGLILGLAVWGWVSARKAELRSRELQVALESEKSALRDVEAARKLAEQQEALARKMGGLAENREQQAEARLKDLLRVFDSVVVAARWNVAKLPGGTSASIQLLEKTLEQIESMPATPATRANYLLLRAEAHSQLADLYDGANSNVGDKQHGDAHREKALLLRGELHRLEPDRLDWERAYEEQRFQSARGKLPKGLTGSSADWDAFERRFLSLRKRAQKDVVFARAIGTFYFHRSLATAVGNAKKKADMEAALRYFSDGGDGADDTVMRNQALAHKYMLTLVDAEAKMQHATEALRLDRTRVANDSTNAGAKLDMGFSLVSVADANYALKRLPEAQRGYWEGYELRKQLALMDPSNVFAWRALSYPIRMYGYVSVYLGDKKALATAVKELEWVMERQKPAAGALDQALISYWKGWAALNEMEACRFFAETAQILEKDPKGRWLHSRTELQGQLKQCPNLIQ